MKEPRDAGSPTLSWQQWPVIARLALVGLVIMIVSVHVAARLA